MKKVWKMLGKVKRFYESYKNIIAHQFLVECPINKILVFPLNSKNHQSTYFRELMVKFSIKTSILKFYQSVLPEFTKHLNFTNINGTFWFIFLSRNIAEII